MNYYALTLKKNVPKNVTCKRSDYDVIWKTFEKYDVQTRHLQWELDRSLRLHYHGVVILPKNFYRRKLMLEGFHLNLLPLRTMDDYNRWVRYCYKDVPPEEWPDIIFDEHDPPIEIKSGQKARNYLTCCNNNTVDLELSPKI